MLNALKVVGDFQQSMGRGDFAAARQLLHDRLTFQGPIAQFDSAEPYLAAVKKLHSIVQRVDVKKTFVDSNDVCVLYDMVTNTPAGTAFIAEWFQVKGDKIVAIRVVFDARPFAAMFAN